MRQLGEIIGDIIPLGLFIYMAIILHGIAKYPNEKAQEKIEALKEKKGAFLLVWSGVAIFSILVLKHFI